MPEVGEGRQDQTASATKRGFDMLVALAELDVARPTLDGSHSLAEIAQGAGIPGTTALRYLQDARRARLVTQTQRGRYALTPTAGAVLAPAPALPAATTHVLTQTQQATGQIVLLYAAELVGEPIRVRRGAALGQHHTVIQTAPAAAQAALETAPLQVTPNDAVALAILAALEGRRRTTPRLLEDVLDCGFAQGPSPLAGWITLAAPVWRGATVAGALAVLVSEPQLRYQYRRDEYLQILLNATAALSRNSMAGGTSLRAVPGASSPSTAIGRETARDHRALA
ncbi:helix-turn-helix domain-containing protein (plasmid) [Actinacidiphila glaucinigra]|uniref:helix-turn-helix domain-containing protein n=1 Tax=Actinacidiphila glaucinigra TaxID=235986 RepID=UPI002DDC0826|nr:helix-turn-helix domain-containing protein [Actinacidiphila glaucinigra]WSD65913.1 helix-turn-helix domain-containing protein [Actinacidiphila glaucinigra]